MADEWSDSGPRDNRGDRQVSSQVRDGTTVPTIPFLHLGALLPPNPPAQSVA